MVTKTFIDRNTAGGAGATLSPTAGAFDSSAYTHLVAYSKHETNNTNGATFSDNKGSGTWNKLTQQDDNGQSGWVQLHWVKIGTPGAGHTVTMTTNAAADFRTLALWGVNSTTGELELVDESFGEGNGTTFNPGTLSNAGADSCVGFYGVGDHTGTSYTPPTGWTEDGDEFAGFANSTSYGSIASSSTSIAVSGGTLGATADWGSVAAIFRELAADDGTVIPETDVATAGWTPTPAGSLATCINEIGSPDDGDYITSPFLRATADPYRFTLDEPMVPGVYQITVRGQVTGGAGQVRAVFFNASGTVVGTSSYGSLGTSLATLTLPVTITGTDAVEAQIEVIL